MEPFVTILTTTDNIIKNGNADAFNLLVTLLDMQTYHNVEHLIIDKMSTDGTVEMLKDYKNKGYLQFFSERDTGKFNAYNKGIMHAKGKYIAFLSCDDFIHDITAIADIVELLENNNGDCTFAPAYWSHPEDCVFLFEPTMYNAFQVMPGSRQAMFFKKSMLEKENYFDEKFKLMADFDLIIRIMLKKYKGLYFNRNYVTYKLGEKGLAEPERVNEESKNIFYKNYRNLYPLNDEILERMVRLSEFPKPLLDKLATCFPEADRQLFYERCETMNNIRVNALQNQ